MPKTYTKKIVVNLVVIQDDEHPEFDVGAGVQDNPWKLVEQELKSLALASQTIIVDKYTIKFAECELCVAAYTHSLKSHTSNVLSEGLRTQVHQYLDSVELVDWLEHFENAFWGIKAAAAKEHAGASVQVVTAFVYDLSTKDVLLLDRFHQAIYSKDLIVAVQTQAVAAIVDYSCDDHAVQFNPRDASRAVLAAVLQGLYGVAPTHVWWSPVSNASETDYTWSHGLTPFGYFSQSNTLSFAIRDAAARHVLLSDLNQTMTEVADLLLHFSSFGEEIEQVLSAVSRPHEHIAFIRRWNLLKYKLTKAQYFLSLNNFNQSLYYTRSARHDLAALHAIVHSAVDYLLPVVVCGQEASWLSKFWSALFHAFQMILLVFIIIRVAKFVGPTSKSKKF